MIQRDITTVEPLFPIKHKDLWGYATHDGRVVVDPFGTSASGFREKYGYIDHRDCKTQNTLHFYDIEGVQIGYLENAFSYTNFSEGLLRFRDSQNPLEAKEGYCLPTGKIAIPALYDFATDFSGGVAVVSFDCKLYGLIDKQGKLVLEPKYAAIFPFEQNSDYAAAQTVNGIWVLIDKVGQEVCSTSFDGMRPPAEGYVPFWKITPNGSYFGVADIDGSIVIPPVFDECQGPIANGMLGVETSEGPWGVISIPDGEWVLEPNLTFVGGPFSNGLFLAYKGGSRNLGRELLGGKFGYVDKSGTEIIPFQFDHAFPFSGDYANVEVFLDDCPALREEPTCDHDHETSEGYVDINGIVTWTHRPILG